MIEPTDKTDIMLPIHPGEYITEEFLKPLGITPYRLAKDIGVTENRVHRLLKGEASMTADMAMRLHRYFNISAEFWLNMQAFHDLRLIQRTAAGKYANIRLRPEIDTLAMAA